MLIFITLSILILAATIPASIGHTVKSDKLPETIQKNSANFENNKNMTDIPTWYIGDRWNYTTNIMFNSENLSCDITATNMTLKVDGVTDLQIKGKKLQVYRNEISGEITGHIKPTSEEISWNFPIWGDITGYSYTKVSDLSQVKTEVTLLGQTQVGAGISIWIFNFTEEKKIAFEMDIKMKFDPPVESYDFPVKIGEKWLIYSTTDISFNMSFAGDQYKEHKSMTFSQQGNMTCTKKDTLVVPAGAFTGYYLSSIDISNNSMCFVPEVKNVGSIFLKYQDEKNTLLIDSELKSYQHISQTIIVDEYIDPYIQIPGKEIIVHGKVTNAETNVSIGSEEVVVEIPNIEKNWTIYTDEEGYYSLSIPAPNVTDNTPSSSEYGGSAGIIVRCTLDGKTGYKVKTFVSDRDNAKPAVSIDHPQEGYLYIKNEKICRFFTSCVVGSVDIEVSAMDNETGIKRVMFYVGDDLKATLEDSPYIWTWGEKLFGKYKIKVVAYDSFGNHKSDEINLLRFT